MASEFPLQQTLGMHEDYMLGYMDIHVANARKG